MTHRQTHQYQYDLAGNRTQVEYSTGRVVEATYDGLNRPEVISEGGRVTRYGYDLAGRAVVLVGGNGQTSSNTYDALGRLQDRTLFRTAAMTSGEVLAEFSWDHDLLGNVLAQHETWPGDTSRGTGIRSTVMEYDDNNRLLEETIQTRTSGTDPPADQSTTLYTYDDANNRSTKRVQRIAGAASSAEAGENEEGYWEYTYNEANQLTGWEKWDEEGGSLQKTATLSYDEAGNRTRESVQTQGVTSPAVKAFAWDAQDRLLGVTMPDGSVHSNEYDYRTRRIGTSFHAPGSTPPAPPTKQTAIVFAGGLSVAEWETDTGILPVSPTVEYTRGPDMGGGVGGLLYSLRDESGTATPRYNLSNGRGDIVAQSSQAAALTWTASYEAYGKRTKETGTNKDKQRGNSKDEDPTGLLNEGFRYRDLETGVWLSRDPAGFVDGPNLYAYCVQNPWSKFDPLGLLLTTAEAAAANAAVGEGGAGTAAPGFVMRALPLVGVLFLPSSEGPAEARERQRAIAKYTPTMCGATNGPQPLRTGTAIPGGASLEDQQRYMRDKETNPAAASAALNNALAGGASAKHAAQSSESAVENESPVNIRFSQRTVDGNVRQYVNDMREGKWDWNKSGPARVMEVDGKLVSYDNRRVMAAQQAGLPEIPIQKVDPEDIMPGSKKLGKKPLTSDLMIVETETPEALFLGKG